MRALRKIVRLPIEQHACEGCGRRGFGLARRPAEAGPRRRMALFWIVVVALSYWVSGPGVRYLRWGGSASSPLPSSFKPVR